MSAALQFGPGKLTTSRSLLWVALLVFHSLSSVSRLEVTARAQDSAKVRSAKASTPTLDVQQERPREQAGPRDLKSTASEASTDTGQAKLLADARRMKVLSRELQAEILNSKPDTLSLSALKKLDEMQKLATVVKAEIGRQP